MESSRTPKAKELRTLFSVLFMYAISTMPYYMARTYIRTRLTRKKQYDEWKQIIGRRKSG